MRAEDKLAIYGGWIIDDIKEGREEKGKQGDKIGEHDYLRWQKDNIWLRKSTERCDKGPLAHGIKREMWIGKVKIRFEMKSEANEKRMAKLNDQKNWKKTD